MKHGVVKSWAYSKKLYTKQNKSTQAFFSSILFLLIWVAYRLLQLIKWNQLKFNKMLVRIFLLLLVFMLTSSEISQDGTFLYHKVGFRKIENQHLVKYKPVQYTLKLRIWTIMKKGLEIFFLCNKWVPNFLRAACYFRIFNNFNGQTVKFLNKGAQKFFACVWLFFWKYSVKGYAYLFCLDFLTCLFFNFKNQLISNHFKNQILKDITWQRKW